MKIPSFSSLKPLTRVAVVVVILGIAFFLLLPLVVGPGAGGGSYPLSEGDKITNWSWQGAYADGAQKEADTKDEIARLKAQLGKGKTSDYDLEVGLASQYELLGDGKSAYSYLAKAIAADPSRGIAYMNMGHLMEELGALATAHKAYDAAVAAEPTNPIYETARQNFLIQHTVVTPK